MSERGRERRTAEGWRGGHLGAEGCSSSRLTDCVITHSDGLWAETLKNSKTGVSAVSVSFFFLCPHLSSPFLSEMSHAVGPNGTGPAPLSDYEWSYEYYDEEELVSFEGLKVHRCE